MIFTSSGNYHNMPRKEYDSYDYLPPTQYTEISSERFRIKEKERGLISTLIGLIIVLAIQVSIVYGFITLFFPK